jgi:hypothetical protein
MDDKPQWGLISRLAVATVAAMVVAIAAKPYEKKVLPVVESLKAKGSSFISRDLPRRERGESVPKLVTPAKSTKEMDKITKEDKSKLESVLDKL